MDMRVSFDKGRIYNFSGTLLHPDDTNCLENSSGLCLNKAYNHKKVEHQEHSTDYQYED